MKSLRGYQNKMYDMMTNHYIELKQRLGLLDVKEDTNDILNDPVPMEEKFPKSVVKQ